MKKVFIFFNFLLISISASSQALDSTMNYCFGMQQTISSFEDWTRPMIFDFDKDGDMDFVVLELWNDSLAVYINNGAADFTVTPAVKISIPSNQVDLCAADFDNDTYIDIATISDVGDLNLFKNISSTSYTLANSIANTTVPNVSVHSIEAHDFNGDGKYDIIGTYQDISFNTFYAFTFQQGAVPFNFGAINPFLIFAGHNAQFNLPMTHFALGDFDADSFVDLAVGCQDLSDTIEIYRNSGSTSISFNAPVTYTNPVGGGTWFVESKDCNSDGMPDLSITSTGGFSIGKNLASAMTFAPLLNNSSVFGRQFDILDLNSDNKPEMITADFGGSYYIYTGTSSVSVNFNNNYNYFSLYDRYKFGLADFDGNSTPDILFIGTGDAPYIQLSRNFSFHVENIVVSSNSVICGSTPVQFSVTNTSTYPGVNNWSPGPAMGTNYTATTTGSVSCAFSFTLPPGLGQCTLFTDSIYVNSPGVPSAAFNSSLTSAVCPGTNVSLYVSVVPASTSYTWSTGSSASSIVVNPLTTTTYSVFMDDGCQATATYTVFVNPQPTVNITAPATSICNGDSLVLTANGASGYTWSPSGSTSNNITVKPATTSIYSLIGENSFGCSDTTATTITVNALPSISIISSKPVICFPDTLTLSASGAMSYTWSTGSNLSVITVTPFASGNYSVTGSNGCVSTASISLPILLRPTVTAVASKPGVCLGDSVTLTAAGAVSYTWAAPFQFGSQAVFYPAGPTTYSVLGLGANGCYNYTTIAINSAAANSVSITSTELCLGQSANISATGALTYTWNTGFVGQTFSFLPPGLNPVTFTVAATDANGCKTAASQQFIISDKCQLIIYNGVTPNSDGKNDFFRIENIEQYPGNEVAIFNRWGQKLAEIRNYNNTDNFWPGLGIHDNGSGKVPSGTYYYIIDLNNGTELLKGFIELTKKDTN